MKQTSLTTPLLDKIFIRNLQVDAVIGVYDFEKSAPQPLSIDYELTLPLSQAGQTDQLSDTVDYAQVAELTLQHIQETQYELLETLGEALCQQLFERFPSLQIIQITLAKPQAVPQAQSVGIQLIRQRRMK